MKKTRKIALTLITAALLAASAAGCSEKQSDQTQSKYAAGEVTYPIKTEGEKVTYWVGLKDRKSTRLNSSH